MTPMSEAEMVILDLAAIDPAESDPGCGCCSSGQVTCHFCGEDFDYDRSRRVWELHVKRHKSTCVWRRAKELT